MINAKEAHKQTEASLLKNKESAWKMIEESIKLAIDSGNTKCEVFIKKEILDEIEQILKYVYGYTVTYDRINWYLPNYYHMTISW